MATPVRSLPAVQCTSTAPASSRSRSPPTDADEAGELCGKQTAPCSSIDT